MEEENKCEFLPSDALMTVCNGSCGNKMNQHLFFEFVNPNSIPKKESGLTIIQLTPDIREKIQNYALWYRDIEKLNEFFKEFNLQIDNKEKAKNRDNLISKTFFASDFPMRKKLIHLMGSRHSFLQEENNRYYRYYYNKLKNSKYYIISSESCNELWEFFSKLKSDKFDDIIMHLINHFCYSDKQSIWEQIESNCTEDFFGILENKMKELKKANEYKKLVEEGHPLNDNELISIWAYSQSGVVSSRFHDSHYKYQQCQWRYFYRNLYTSVHKLNILHHKLEDEFPHVLYHGVSVPFKAKKQAISHNLNNNHHNNNINHNNNNNNPRDYTSWKSNSIINSSSQLNHKKSNYSISHNDSQKPIPMYTIFSATTSISTAERFATSYGTLFTFKNANVLLKRGEIIAASIKWISPYQRENEWLCLPMQINDYNIKYENMIRMTAYSYVLTKFDFSGHVDPEQSLPFLYTVLQTDDLRKYKDYILLLETLFNPILRFKCPKCKTDSYFNDYNLNDIFEKSIKCPACFQYILAGYQDNYLTKIITCYNPDCPKRDKQWIKYKFAIGKGLKCPNCNVFQKEWYDEHIKLNDANIKIEARQKKGKILLQFLLKHLKTTSTDSINDINLDRVDCVKKSEIEAYTNATTIFINGWVNFLLKLNRGLNNIDDNNNDNNNHIEKLKEENLKKYLDKLKIYLSEYLNDHQAEIYSVSRKLFNMEDLSFDVGKHIYRFLFL